MFNMAIYNKIKIRIEEKALRENRKLSQRIVAEEVGIPLSVLTLYASQKVKRIDTTTLSKLCEYFGVQPGDLLIYSADQPQATKKTPRK